MSCFPISAGSGVIHDSRRTVIAEPPRRRPVTTPLVTPPDLASELTGKQPPVLLDVRWTLAGSDRAAYLAGHLPRAIFVDLDRELAAPVGNGSLGRHPLPDPPELERTWRAAGVGSGRPVVVYDARDGSSAARAWWLLRWSGVADVRVLDGGFAGWSSAGLPVEEGQGPAPAPGNMEVHPGGMPTIDPDDAATLGDRGALLDARVAGRYRGDFEPIDPIAGHIPGAASLPAGDLLQADGTFRSADELKNLFADRGIAAGTVAGAYCGSGVTACHLVLGGAVAGIELALYPGSWSQWCALGRPVATGAG
jgi:thiosulfate/3-mercaptopyruvate sulfurtransferase